MSWNERKKRERIAKRGPGRIGSHLTPEMRGLAWFIVGIGVILVVLTLVLALGG